MSSSQICVVFSTLKRRKKLQKHRISISRAPEVAYTISAKSLAVKLTRTGLRIIFNAHFKRPLMVCDWFLLALVLALRLENGRLVKKVG